MEKIKVGFVGAGYMAEEHIKVFGDSPEVQMIGIHSRTRSRAEALAKKYEIPFVYDSIEALYAGTNADLVIIAVKELSANRVCTDALKYPWQVLIEKPAGYDLKDALDISDAAFNFGRKAFVALNRRHYSSTRAVVAELVGAEGQRIVQVFDQENPRVALESGAHPLVVQNWMYANSIHLIDYFRIFCRGEIIGLNPIIKWDPKAPSYVFTKLEYSSGDIGLYQAVWNAPGPWGVSVTTQSKRWEMRPLEQAFSQLYKSRISEPLSLHHWDTKFKPGLRFQVEEAIKAVRGEANCLPTLADGIATMKLVNKIYES